MIIVELSEKCPVCRVDNGFAAKVKIDQRHIEITEHDEGVSVFDRPWCEESVFTHPGLEYDGAIRIACKACNASASLQIGSIEMTCAPADERKDNTTWVPEGLAEVVE